MRLSNRDVIANAIPDAGSAGAARSGGKRVGIDSEFRMGMMRSDADGRRRDNLMGEVIAIKEGVIAFMVRSCNAGVT